MVSASSRTGAGLGVQRNVTGVPRDEAELALFKDARQDAFRRDFIVRAEVDRDAAAVLERQEGEELCKNCSLVLQDMESAHSPCLGRLLTVLPSAVS